MLGLRRCSAGLLAATRLCPQRCWTSRRAFDTLQRAQVSGVVDIKRYVSTEIEKGSTGESDSGHISAGPNEGIFFLESMESVALRFW